MTARRSPVICPECSARVTRHTLRKHRGACRECDQEPRTLSGEAKQAAIAEFMTWLAGRLPSEALREEAASRPHLLLANYDDLRKAAPWH